MDTIIAAAIGAVAVVLAALIDRDRFRRQQPRNGVAEVERTIRYLRVIERLKQEVLDAQGRRDGELPNE